MSTLTKMEGSYFKIVLWILERRAWVGSDLPHSALPCQNTCHKVAVTVVWLPRGSTLPLPPVGKLIVLQFWQAPPSMAFIKAPGG